MSLPSSSSGSNDKSGRDVGLEEDQDVDDDEEEFFEAETLPIIGRCQSLYPFEGNLNDQIFFEFYCSKSKASAVFTVYQIILLNSYFFVSTGEPLAFQTLNQSQWSIAWLYCAN